MADECLICGAPLVYLDRPIKMVCALCGEEQMSRVRCEEGHFVCDDCHRAGVVPAISSCAEMTSADPIAVFEQLVSTPGIYMHGPEHHVLVTAALLTAYKNAGGDIDLDAALREALERCTEVPGGACGFWGACGACIGCGIFASIVMGTTPLDADTWGAANGATAAALSVAAAVGGPRCCKRNSYIALTSGAKFAAEHLGVRMDVSAPRCTRCGLNAQCIGPRCPFNPARPKN